jgi:hypothetical protein
MKALAKAMRAGDFYSTSGVEISDILVSASSYQVQAKARPGETLTIEFLGARKSQGEQAPEPQVLATSQAEQATYEFQGDELFVRSRITSSLAHSAPKVKGELQRAWTQPIQPGK